MVKVKGAQCNDCCCNDCGVRPQGDAKECCYCVCDELCVRVEVDYPELNDLVCGPDDPAGTPCDCVLIASDCGCVAADGKLTWDPVDCRWEGTVACGLLSIDLQVELKNCNGDCVVCVSSTCLGLSGDCAAAQAGPLGPGWLTFLAQQANSGCHPLVNCGKYVTGCDDAEEAVLASFNVDFGGCGDTDCREGTITIKCRNITNPQPSPPICSNCDCVCECVCLTYTEDNCTVVKQACWDGTKYQATFDDGCSWSAQTATITLTADSSGCCEWNLATSRGTVTTPKMASDCPDPDVTWNLTSPTATLRMQCADCNDECRIDNDCCEDDNLPIELWGKICLSGECPVGCVQLYQSASTATEICWRGTTTIQCAEIPTGCQDWTVDIEVCCIRGSALFEVRIYCGGSIYTSSTASTTNCDPLCIHAGPLPVDQTCSDYTCSIGSTSGLFLCITEESCL